MEIYYYEASSKIEIKDGSRLITIPLPAGLNPVEVAEVIQSETLISIIRSLTERDDSYAKIR